MIQTIIIRDVGTGEFVFSIDFLETPHEYRLKRHAQLLIKYPEHLFIWNIQFEIN